MVQESKMKTFESIMTEYKQLPLTERSLVRQVAVAKLLEYSPEEIGSSDVNHSIVSLYNSEGSFNAIVDNCLDLI
jgi:hypothetical protein